MGMNRSNLLYETTHKMKHLRLAEYLDLMPQAEFITLGVISELTKADAEKPVCISDIAQHLRVSPPAVSRNIKHLEEKNFVERVTDNDDRRNVYVNLTETGKAAMEGDIQKVSEFVERALSHLSEEEMTQFSALFDKIYDAIKLEATKMKEAKPVC